VIESVCDSRLCLQRRREQPPAAVFGHPLPDLIVKNLFWFFAIQSDELTSFREIHISYFADPARESGHGGDPEAK